MEKERYLKSIRKFYSLSHKATALVGFDGFIDVIAEAVDTRYDKNNYKRIDTIENFGKRILQAKGKSTNIEIVQKLVKVGGNAPLMSNPMIKYGVNLHFIGCIGENKIEDIFKEFAQNCTSYHTLAKPGKTEAIEFSDGKIMLGITNHLFDINWQVLLERIGEDTLKDLAKDINLFAFVNWTMLAGMDSIIKGSSDYFINNPYVFIDLADPQKRTKADLKKILYLIKDISYKSKVVFGMNKKESEQIAEVLGIDIDDLSERADRIREYLNLNTILLHSLKFAIVSTKDLTEYQTAPYEPKPLLTTGAGDNLNGGFCAALLSGLTVSEALSVGLFTVGFYVRKGFSPTKKQLLNFAQDYFKEK